MSIMTPKIELVDRTLRSIRYLEHGWPTELCRWHAHEEYELHLVVATRGKAFVGDYIGEFEPGYLYLTGPHLPHNWVTDEVNTDTIPLRDMLVQFSHESVEKLASGARLVCETEIAAKFPPLAGRPCRWHAPAALLY